jgi:membrane protein DedA with SNARE-associated domain
VGGVLSTLATIAAQAHHHDAPKLDYLGIGLAAVVSWVGLPGPGEAALIAAGVSAARGHIDLASVLAAAWAGAMLGGVVGWLVGRYGGRPFLERGTWLLEQRRRALDHGAWFFERFGWIAVYFAPSWAAGINAMSASRFLVANAVCALAWSLLFGVGAYALGPSVTDLADDVGLVATVLIVAAAISAYVFARRRRRRARHPLG